MKLVVFWSIFVVVAFLNGIEITSTGNMALDTILEAA